MYRVALPQTDDDRAADIASWKRVGGRPVWTFDARQQERQKADPRDPRLCTATNKYGEMCGSWSAFSVAGKRYCAIHGKKEQGKCLDAP